MQEKQIDIQRYEEDEIDLKELAKTLWKSKVKIIGITFVITILAIIYVFFKNPVPVYQGSIMVEVGVGVGVGVKQIPSQVYFDNPNNLKSIIEQKFNSSVEIPKKTSNIVIISSNNIDKDIIKSNLKTVVSYIIQKHTKKLKLYDKYIMTKQIGDIKINNAPINKVKKKLIVVVAFITGFILSIFLVFFLEFIKGFKKEDFED